MTHPTITSMLASGEVHHVAYGEGARFRGCPA